MAETKEYEHARGALEHSHREEDKASHSHPHHGVHVEKLHDGYKVTKHHRDGHTTEHGAADIEDAHDHMHDHLVSDPESQEPEGQGGAEPPNEGSVPTQAPPPEEEEVPNV